MCIHSPYLDFLPSWFLPPLVMYYSLIKNCSYTIESQFSSPIVKVFYIFFQTNTCKSVLTTIYSVPNLLWCKSKLGRLNIVNAEQRVGKVCAIRQPCDFGQNSIFLGRLSRSIKSENQTKNPSYFFTLHFSRTYSELLK